MQQVIYQSFGDAAEIDRFQTILAIYNMTVCLAQVPGADPERVQTARQIANYASVLGRCCDVDTSVQIDGSHVVADLFCRWGTYSGNYILSLLLRECDTFSIGDGRDYGCDAAIQFHYDVCAAPENTDE